MISRGLPRWLIETGLCKALAMMSPDLRDRSLVENVRTILSFIEGYQYSKYSNDVNGVECPLRGWLSHRRYDRDNGDMPHPAVSWVVCHNLIAFWSADERACYSVVSMELRAAAKPGFRRIILIFWFFSTGFLPGFFMSDKRTYRT
jgi:hypothetical protein